MRDNQTTRRMPMIVTAMVCATASMLAGLTLAPSAMAAGTAITLQGADGAGLSGRTFDVYRIGTYTDQILNGTQISGLGVRGATASNAWAADPNPNPTRRCRRAEGNRPARPNEPQTSPSPTNHRHPTGDGRTA